MHFSLNEEIIWNCANSGARKKHGITATYLFLTDHSDRYLTFYWPFNSALDFPCHIGRDLGLPAGPLNISCLNTNTLQSLVLNTFSPLFSSVVWPFLSWPFLFDPFYFSITTRHHDWYFRQLFPASSLAFRNSALFSNASFIVRPPSPTTTDHSFSSRRSIFATWSRVVLSFAWPAGRTAAWLGKTSTRRWLHDSILLTAWHFVFSTNNHWEIFIFFLKLFRTTDNFICIASLEATLWADIRLATAEGFWALGLLPSASYTV